MRILDFVPLVQLDQSSLSRRLPRVVCHVGHTAIGGDHPVAIQSMTNTETAKPADTTRQVTV